MTSHFAGKRNEKREFQAKIETLREVLHKEVKDLIEEDYKRSGPLDQSDDVISEISRTFFFMTF